MGLERYIEIPLKKLRKAAWNYKNDNPEKAVQLRGNLERNSQMENLIVRELGKGLYEVVNGNHRLDEMIELKFETAVCYNCGKISDAAAYRIAVETNETRFDSNPAKLAELVQQITLEYDKEDLLKTMPYNESELESLMKMSDFNWNQFEEMEKENEENSNQDVLMDIKLKVPNEVYQLWLQWLARAADTLSIEDPREAFEFAIINAMKIPNEQLTR